MPSAESGLALSVAVGSRRPHELASGPYRRTNCKKGTQLRGGLAMA